MKFSLKPHRMIVSQRAGFSSEMRPWNSLKSFIRSKVFSAFIVVLVFADGLGVFALQRLGAVNDAAADIRDSWLPSLRVVGQIAMYSERIRANQNTYLMQVTTRRGRTR